MTNEVEQVIEAYKQRLKESYGPLGLNEYDSPDTIQALEEAQSTTEAERLVGEWLQDTVYNQRTQIEELRRAQQANGRPNQPQRLSPKQRRRAEELKLEAQRTGKSRLSEWLKATEPLLNEDE